jgi:hypothetical protein
VAWRKKETKVNDACCALYISALVAGVLELETTVLHVPNPTVECMCTTIMMAIPLFPIVLIRNVWMSTLLCCPLWCAYSTRERSFAVRAQCTLLEIV